MHKRTCGQRHYFYGYIEGEYIARMHDLSRIRTYFWARPSLKYICTKLDRSHYRPIPKMLAFYIPEISKIYFWIYHCRK